MVKELLFIITVDFMKENGSMIKEKEEVLKYFQMETVTKENIKEVNLLEKVYILGRKGKFTMGSGTMEKRKVTGYGQDHKKIHTLVNGKRVKLMVMVFMFGKMVIVMKESGDYA